MAKTVKHDDLKSLWGSEDLLEVAQNRSFAGVIFELLSEKVPTEEQLKVFELILNLSIDHGAETPSATKVIESAKNGGTISEAVASGILEINDTHGGAIEPAMEVLYKIKSSKLKVQSLVEEYLKEDKRLPGFGHRIYKEVDPRAELILKKLVESGFSDEFAKIGREIEVALESQKGQKLVLNIDGAIAVVLCTFGWEARLGKAVFLIARTPGLCAHFLNSTTTI
ncbi:MAG: citrate/2-methylcitrate synthase [Candidatus Daviesbacteria bacterium]|nr:citrate/2-methylcitrate synthase [Candidatus Daviesbacteria bacterium]